MEVVPQSDQRNSLAKLSSIRYVIYFFLFALCNQRSNFKKQMTGGSSHLRVVESRRPTRVREATISPLDKPLPSPPVCQVLTSVESRGLIDAIEKPLRRSPPGKPEYIEEWPVLSPEKRVKSKSSVKLGTSSAIPRLATKATLTTSSGHISPCEIQTNNDMSKPELVASSNKLDDSAPISVEQNIAGINTKDVIQHASTIPYTCTGPASRPSSVSSTFKQPRQTRTTKLRASLLSGNAGHAGNTIIRTTSDIKGTSMYQQYENVSGRMRPGYTRPNSPVSHEAPAHDVVESHFLRNLEPKISCPQTYTGNTFIAQHPHTICLDMPNNIKASEQSDTSPAPPTTLVPNVEVSAYQKEDESDSGISGTTTMPSSNSADVLRNDFDIFEEPLDRAALGVIDSMDRAASTSIESTSDEVSTLHAIFSAPGNTSSVKRLSKTAPAYGPTLRLSPSADRYIMGGDGPDKVESSDIGANGRDFPRPVVTKELQKARRDATCAFRKDRDLIRPLTGQGSAPQSRSTSLLGSSEIRMKKTRCAETDDSGPADCSQPDFGRKKGNADGGRKTSTLISKDPFVDVQLHDGDITKEPSHVDLVRECEKLSGSFSSLEEDKERPATLENARGVKISNVNKAYGSDNLQLQVSKTVPAAATVEDPTIERTEGENLTQLYIALACAEKATNSNIGRFPPRSSSRAAAPDHTTNGSTQKIEASQSGLERHVSNNSTQPALRNKLLAQDIGSAPSKCDLDAHLAKRGSIAQLSTNLPKGHSKRVLSNVKGFFHLHKRSSDKNEPTASAVKFSTKQPEIRRASNGSPLPSLAEVHPLHRPTISSINKRSDSKGAIHSMVMTTPVTPVVQSPRSSRVSETMALAMQILESVRHETSSPQKERLLELGKVMVDALTQARDAEKAMEEAKQAARKAEVSYLLCSKSVREVTQNVLKWQRELQSTT